jgi:adenylate cyclase
MWPAYLLTEHRRFGVNVGTPGDKTAFRVALVWARLVGRVESVGADPNDSVEVRSQKRVLVLVSVIVAVLALGWGATYFAYDEPLAAFIPWTYSVAVGLSVAVFAATGRYAAFRFTQLLLILLLPFLLQLALGGFVGASAVIIWSLLAPLGALAMVGRREAVAWFLAYVALVLLAQVVQPSLRIENLLPTTIIAVFFVANIVAATGVSFYAMQYFVGEKDTTLAKLDQERAKSERLLLNVLPREIAEILKENDEIIATRYQGISVMFADVVGFTSLSDQLPADDIVALLNDVFSHFDSLVERFGLEKIRTMGDSYMVASGVPTAREDHAQVLAEMALAMMDYHPVTAVALPVPLRFRAGISSGPALAGVIGRAKFQYDVWGDTVNTASRMETHGVPGRIQISQTTYELVQDEFLCEPRGVVAVKGMGPMETWFLLGSRSTESPLTSGSHRTW